MVAEPPAPSALADYDDLPPATPASPPLAAATLDSLSPETLRDLKERAKGDLFFFAKGVLGFDRLHPRIHKPLCRLLELYGGYNESLAHPWAVYRKVLYETFRRAGVPEEEWEKRALRVYHQGTQFLMILMPRGWYKTTLVSISYPIWRGVRDSNVRVLLTQNTSTNAKSKGNALASAIMGNDLFKALFPEVLPGPTEKWSEDGRTLKRPKAFAESTYEFAGTRTQVTSRHFNVIIEDDTVAPDKDDLGENSILPSKADVTQAIGWHRLVPPLLDEIRADQSVIAGTRWFVLDLLAWVMANEKQYVVYQWAVREDKDGKPDSKGELTWPERFDSHLLSNLAASLGPYLYSCLYMNTPVQSDDMLFRPEWVRYYDVEPSRLMTFTTVDFGNDPTDTKGAPDFNVILTCGKDMQEGKVFVLDYSRERCSPSRTIELIFGHVRKWHPVTVGMESVAFQKSMAFWLRQHMVTHNEYFSVTQLAHNKKSKAARIRGLQPAMSSGTLYFRAGQQALINELMVYPLGTNDDLADALAMQLELWRVTPSSREKAVASEGGPCDFDTMIAAATAQQKKVDRERGLRGPPPAWGGSVPILVFEGGAEERLGVREGVGWGRDIRVLPRV